MDKKFVKHCELLRKLGCAFRTATEMRGKGDSKEEVSLPLFTSVNLEFTSHEWCNLMMTEGRFYMGSCCASMASVQDDLNQVFRFESGWFDASMLVMIANHLRHHDTERPVKDLTRAVNKLSKLMLTNDKKRMVGKYMIQPAELIDLVGYILEPFTSPEAPKATVNLNEYDDAIHSLTMGLRFLSRHDLVERHQSEGMKEFNKEWASQTAANRALLLAKIMAPLKTVSDKLNELEPFVFEGVALVTKDEPDELTSNGQGICVFGSEEEAKKLIDFWSNEEELYEDKNNIKRKPADFFKIRPIVVTTEGLKFKDDLHDVISN